MFSSVGAHVVVHPHTSSLREKYTRHDDGSLVNTLKLYNAARQRSRERERKGKGNENAHVCVSV